MVTRGQSLNQFLIFLCSTFFAHLSDMVGRRPCLIVAFAGTEWFLRRKDNLV